MRKIFVVNTESTDKFFQVVRYIGMSVPNIIALDYYDVILKDVIKSFGVTNITTKDYMKIEEYWIKNYKQALINEVLNAISNRNGDRTTLFILCNNRLIMHYIRKTYGYHNVKVLRLESTLPNNLYEDKLYPIKHNDIKLTFVDENRVLRERIIDQFINTHIPVKWFINN